MSDSMGFSDEEIEQTRSWLRAFGATEDDLDVDVTDLAGVTLDVLLRQRATLSARQLAERTGRSPDDVVELYHELGVTVDDLDEVRFTEREVDLVDMLQRAVVEQFTPEEGHGLIVVTAKALRSIADASVSGFVQTIEARLLADGGSLLDWARATAEAGELGMHLSQNLGSLFNHYLRQAVMHQREAQQGVSSRAVQRVAVGFVDLVGFTPLSSSLTPEELSELVGDFESQAFDLANEAGVRIVKHIGDEIMFTAVDPAAACRVALQLRDESGATTARPRGGIAHGEVITRHGDYFGPIVNLASRLTDEAIPGEILVPRSMQDVIVDFAFEPAGRRVLKGFEEPVAVLSLS
jgi:adenylate cyclase